MRRRAWSILAPQSIGTGRSILLLLFILPVWTASDFTHQCSIRVKGSDQQQSHIHCWSLQPAADADTASMDPSCTLRLFYNNSRGVLPDPSTWGAPASAIASPGQEGAAGMTPAQLNLTERYYDQGARQHKVCTMRPLLYLHGGPGCKVLLEGPRFEGVTLPDAPDQATQLLVFGGGLSATVRGGSFTNNNATTGIALLAYSTLTLQDTSLTHNTLEKGAVYGSWASVLVVNNATITHNTASGFGAALYLSNGRAVIARSTLSANAAGKGGGAVHAKAGAHLTLLDSRLEDNTVTGAGQPNDAAGGAVQAMDCDKVVITGCNFTNNKSPDLGGALYIYMTVRNRSDALSLCDLQRDQQANVISRSRFERNMAAKGGAVAVYYAGLYVDGSRFLDNRAQTMRPGALASAGQYYDMGVGGALCCDNADVTLYNSTLEQNLAVMDGGAMRIQRGFTNITNSSLASNRAHRNGGGVYLGTLTGSDHIAGLNETTQCYDPSRSQNKGLDAGRVALLVDRSTFDNNTAESNGGGLMLQAGANTTIQASTITRCHAWSNGGGVCTEMADERERDGPKPFDRKTHLTVQNNTRFKDNMGTGWDLFVGPYFELRFADNTPALQPYSLGVTWKKRKCDRGEYVAASKFCEPCASFKYNMADHLHTNGDCDPAPLTAFAPGGAVVVPHTGHWHAVEKPFRDCADCAEREPCVHDIRRCPNPAACKHDHVCLARRHPEARSPDRPGGYDWQTYSRVLCAYEQGYEGSMCGVCTSGFGMTAPFSCSRCMGANTTFSSDGQPTPVDAANKHQLSATYVFYWFVLTCWFTFSVYTALPGDKGRSLAAAQEAPQGKDAGRQPSGSTDESSTTVSTSTQTDMLTINVAADPVGEPADKPTPAAGRQSKNKEEEGEEEEEEEATPLAVVKAVMVYYQWASLLLNLPLEWFPRELNELADKADSNNSFSKFTSFIFGRGASLDCLLQAWGLWSQDTFTVITARAIFIAVVSSIVVPVVLGLSVLLVRAAWYWVRPWVGPASTWRCSCTTTTTTRGKDAHPRTNDPPGAAAAQGSVTAQAITKLPFKWYLFQQWLITLMVLFFENYDKLAQTALGMLFCVELGNREGAPKRWVMDVRLPCPVDNRGTPWAVGVVVFGCLLLCVCVIVPVALAFWLCRRAYSGTLQADAVHAAQPCCGGFRARCGCCAAWSWWCSCCCWGAGPDTTQDRQEKGQGACSMLHAVSHNILNFRFGDYDVRYAKLGRGSASGLQQLRLSQLKLWAVLVWDSILDLHRMCLAIVAMAVMLHELHQLQLVTFVLSIYLGLVLALRPWKAGDIWRLQVLALTVLLASCFGIMACNVYDGDGSVTASQISNYNVTNTTAGTTTRDCKAQPRRLDTNKIRWLVVAVNLVYMVVALGVLLETILREFGWSYRRILRVVWNAVWSKVKALCCGGAGAGAGGPDRGQAGC